ncbi:MAG: 2-succinyl-5-enolpyruvyl-6-hydroxy-3-cyclohexene-1-carboxylic-acid synthase [Bacteroidales bacterium]
MTKRPFKQHINDLAQILKQSGISHVVICPGSRNAPLIQVFQQDSHFTCYSIVDERSAGYIALGMARQLGRPVVVVTTSGTATLNLAPAVAEAYYQHIPLVVLTADRPPEWPPQFGNQRINQENIFLQNSKYFYNLPQETASEPALQNALNTVSQLIKSASTGKRGPVHLNIPLLEPLYEPVPENTSPEYPASPDSKIDEVPPPPEKDQKQVRDAFLSEKNILIIAGMGAYSNMEKELLVTLSAKYQAVVIAENISNLSHENFVGTPELVLGALEENEKQAIEPDLVLLFGGQVVSKRTRLFVQGLKSKPVTDFEMFPLQLFSELAKVDRERENRYSGRWKKIETETRQCARTFFQNGEYCNLTALHAILGSIPGGSTVHLGNSGTIRYAQLQPTRQDLAYYSNRGTSGIDGSLSAAVGAAMVSTGLHVIVLGDLSFVYDSNALWNREFPGNLKIIILNDKGGGIFRLLDGPDRMPFFEKFSVASHPVTIQHIAKAFGIDHKYANDKATLLTTLPTLFSADSGAVVFEVDTSESENSSIFKQFFKSIHNQYYAKT